MLLVMLPNDILQFLTTFLSGTEKMLIRESCKELNQNVDYMQIRIEKMDKEISNLSKGREYILSRLRLASLCGLHEYTVATIWSWITSMDGNKKDALPILRQISNAINKI